MNRKQDSTTHNSPTPIYDDQDNTTNQEDTNYDNRDEFGLDQQDDDMM